ncbi:DUF29 family protein [Argonema galeatum]|uniref:DUF29 family protein n=1 Tax=Argonema galeatum TaxID=2942762 RepID=UPI0020121887|nr:DUF29 family protein [Argonema galeatum]MCL1463567.1 DUF29 domain-containing protein [Argonema galeatum A003/A1]
MEEILELKDMLLKGDIKGSLAIVEELEQMSKDDKINNIGSYGIIVLLHLIKQQVENRSTRSWESSIRNSARTIQRKNKRRKAGGFYLTPEELRLTLEEVYPDAVDAAAREVEEGRYEPEELEELVNKEEIIDRALALILPPE